MTRSTSSEELRVSRHISRFSPNGGSDCVEAGPVLDGSDRIAVRHSHHPEGPIIVYSRTEWNAFLAGVRANEFDFL
ncbi:DUF397 domain-containing protein [Sphaerisporangium rhizosphaerae]|uniref:DUF397 domain-containing protein n=1 Tax=Sphaerisporangium rhizosphaerae TaxID=2269375 RepID=A0ABW2P1G2_9ACTN